MHLSKTLQSTGDLGEEDPSCTWANRIPKYSALFWSSEFYPRNTHHVGGPAFHADGWRVESRRVELGLLDRGLSSGKKAHLRAVRALLRPALGHTHPFVMGTPSTWQAVPASSYLVSCLVLETCIQVMQTLSLIIFSLTQKSGIEDSLEMCSWAPYDVYAFVLVSRNVSCLLSLSPLKSKWNICGFQGRYVV